MNSVERKLVAVAKVGYLRSRVKKARSNDDVVEAENFHDPKYQ
jgi:hypothetical protein